jgi:hypothetical protein
MRSGRTGCLGQCSVADDARSYRSRLRHRRSRGGSAGAADGENPGGLVEVTIVAPPGSRTTVWKDPSGSWVVVDPSGLTMEYFCAPSAVVASSPAVGSGPTVGAGGAGGSAGSVQAAGSAAGAGCDAVSSGPAAADGSHSAPGPKKKPTGLSSGSLTRIITPRTRQSRVARRARPDRVSVRPWRATMPGDGPRRPGPGCAGGPGPVRRGQRPGPGRPRRSWRARTRC